MDREAGTGTSGEGTAITTTQVLRSASCADLVLVLADKVQPSLQPKYSGPLRVLRRWGKVFRLQMEHRDETVSVDRLRPFYVDDSDDGRQQTTPDVGPEDHSTERDSDDWPTLNNRPKRTVRRPHRLGY